jgi:hypothetical protein
MRIETLPNPGVIASGLRLRTECAKAISSAEQYLDAVGKQSLTDFFSYCANNTGGTVTPVLPATQAIVSNANATAPVQNSAGTAVGPGTYTVAGGAVTAIKLAATKAVVNNGDTVNVTNSAGTAVPGTELAVVAAGLLTSVSLPATAAVVNQADANVTVQNSAGAAISAAGVATVAAGVLSNVKLPATVAGVLNGVKITMPNITGTYVNGITFTVAGGVITGGVAS